MGKKNMSRNQQKAVMRKVKHARDFGDNPRIRHSHSEHKKKSKVEPWEN